MRLLSIFGTRPEAIKMAPIIKALQSDQQFDSRVCVTGQHRHLLDQVLKQFSIRPDIDLNIMTPSQDLFDLTSRVLLRLRDVLQSVKPDRVLVQGDTTTSFVASLAAFYSGVPVAHVEAGLRTPQSHLPFPEEQNRRLIARIADLHFAPTHVAKDNLLREGIASAQIFVTGNTVIDALQWVGREQTQHDNGDLSPTILITGHRRENFGPGLADVLNAINTLALSHPGWRFVYPVHLNPKVQGPVDTILGGLPNVELLEPLEYADFIGLMKQSKIVITDSGGVQEEAPTFGKPVLLTREVTGRPEGLEAGAVLLVGCDGERIIKEVEALMQNEAYYQRSSQIHNPFGEGDAAEKIINIFKSRIKEGHV